MKEKTNFRKNELKVINDTIFNLQTEKKSIGKAEAIELKGKLIITGRMELKFSFDGI